ncbi:HAD family hydrolase [Halobacillus sp. BBL2006]|uniref:HAD family hydrolase n=1 Tax=Halobacillus sp. BBL2006 TaxID=1543706 RepID=UPI0006909601|nr:HAD family hydrolase [Halobacillus sp. BBL2006]
MIEQARALIFDLDGTLYEDTDHFLHYAELLKQKAIIEKRTMFKKDYQAIMRDNHPLAIGKVYDQKRDVIITVDPFTNQATQVEEWSGESWSDHEVDVVYPGCLTYDFESLIAIGDGWWLPYSVAMHYGVATREARKCYTATKNFMSSNQFQLTKTRGLKESLHNWKADKVLILVTNSEAYDVERILKILELEGIFHRIVHSAEKPIRTKAIFQEMLEAYGLEPEGIVSIGDNFMNEIAPALEMDMKAIFIHKNVASVSHSNLIEVKSLEELCIDKKTQKRS